MFLPIILLLLQSSLFLESESRKVAGGENEPGDDLNVPFDESFTSDNINHLKLHCEDSFQYPKHSLVETHQINLDLPPEKRWAALVIKKKSKILHLMNHFLNETWAKTLKPHLPLILKTMPSPIREEIIGIADALQVEAEKVLAINIIAEADPMGCTSIVALGENGTIYLGRVFDFYSGSLRYPNGGIISDHTRITNTLLSPLVVQIEFVRKNKVAHRSVTFAGFIASLTATKKNQFAVSVNGRSAGTEGLKDWIHGNHNQSWITQITRNVMDACESYECAKEMLSKTPLLSCFYFILAGTQPTEGCVVARGRTTNHITPLGEMIKPQTEPWFLVQTNYDQWTEVPRPDSRETAGRICMQKLGRKDVLHTLANVLATKPVFTPGNTHTTLMSPSLDLMTTYGPRPLPKAE